MEQEYIKLTVKEEEIMNLFWGNGDMFVRELLELYSEPKPHFNTLSTIVRGLEEKGMLSHKAFGNSHQYFAAISKDEFKERTLKDVIGKYYNNSIFSAVSALVEKKALSAKELKELINLVERGEE